MGKFRICRVKETNRVSDWMVRWRQNKRDCRRFFPTESEARAFKAKHEQLLQNGGSHEEYTEAKKLLAGTGYSLIELLKEALEQRRRSGGKALSEGMTLAEACKKVISNAREIGSREFPTIKGYEYYSAALDRHFGERIAWTITEPEARKYLNSLKGKKRDPAGEHVPAVLVTKVSHLRFLRMALRAAGIENPLPGIHLKNPINEDPLYYNISQVKEFLSISRPEERGMLALALFAALRPTRFNEIPASCFLIDEKIIRIPAALMKTKKTLVLETVPTFDFRDPRPGPPPVLWEWLSRFPYKTSSWSALRVWMQRRFSGKWIHDGFRHTGATYFCAMFGPTATAGLLGDESVEMVKRHYVGHASRADAEAFFALSPDSIDFKLKNMATPISWPPNETLAMWAREKPVSQICKDLGCCWTTVAKRCRKLGIPIRHRGGWTNEVNAEYLPQNGSVPQLEQMGQLSVN